MVRVVVDCRIVVGVDWVVCKCLQILASPVPRINSYTHHTASEPESQYALQRLPDLWALPVQIRLLRQETVQVILVGGLVVGPSRAAKHADPIVRRATVRCRITPRVPTTPGAVPAGARVNEPLVLIGCMVKHPIYNDSHAPHRSLGHQHVEIGQRTEQRVDPHVIRYIVSTISQ